VAEVPGSQVAPETQPVQQPPARHVPPVQAPEASGDQTLVETLDWQDLQGFSGPLVPSAWQTPLMRHFPGCTC
jgi:hypothetical protein